MDDDDALVFAFLDVVELTGLAAVDDIPLVCTVGIDAGEHVHQGGLTGPVFAADGHDLAALDLEVYVVQGLHGQGAVLSVYITHSTPPVRSGTSEALPLRMSSP